MEGENMAKYRTAELRREWNRVAEPAHKITTRSGYDALRWECQRTHAETGRREIEMPEYQSKSGHTELFRF